MSRKLCSILICAEFVVASVADAAEAGEKNGNHFSAHRAFFPFARHIAIVDMSFPLGNFPVFPVHRIETERKMPPNNVGPA